MPPKKPTRKSASPAGAETARLRARFERLLAASAAVFSEHSLERVLQQLVDSARDVVGAKYAALGVLSADGTTLSQFVTSGLSQETRRAIGDLPSGRGLLGLVIRDPHAIRTADINTHPAKYGFPLNHPPMRSFLGVPIVGRQGVFGNLYLTEKLGAREFDAEDEGIAVLLARQAAVAVENARLSEETSRLLGQVQAMQRQRDLFFAMMNHELRNALTGVYGWAERLVRRPPGGEPVPQAAREVYEAAERTITLLNNFLDLTRLDAGRMRPVWRDVDVAGALQRSVAGLRPAADAKGVRFDMRLPSEGAMLRTDPMRLEQILVNLLSNAVRHSPEGTAVVVAVARRDAQLCFVVTDSGPGVPLELHERIFEPFERFDPQSGQGTGLGLPVSHRLAAVLGGHLTVASGPGQGAEFTLALPLAPAEE